VVSIALTCKVDLIQSSSTSPLSQMGYRVLYPACGLNLPRTCWRQTGCSAPTAVPPPTSAAKLHPAAQLLGRNEGRNCCVLRAVARRISDRSSLAQLAELVSSELAPQLRFIRICFIKVVVLVVLRTLQRQLQRQSVLSDLVDPHSRSNLHCSRVRSSLIASLGCSIRLP